MSDVVMGPWAMLPFVVSRDAALRRRGTSARDFRGPADASAFVCVPRSGRGDSPPSTMRDEERITGIVASGDRGWLRASSQALLVGRLASGVVPTASLHPGRSEGAPGS